MAPSRFLPRDLGDDISNTANTFSSWDSCMSEGYCKWPVIVGIIIGSLILVSVIWCCVRCCCCGMDCCCGCFSCFNRCCPGPRRKNEGYQQAPPQQPYGGQYQGPAQPMTYGGYAYRGPQTATFDAPTTKNGKYNEDALPAMPSWDQANSRHVRDEDVEMEKLGQDAAQKEGLLGEERENGGRYYNNGAPQDPAGDLGMAQTGPYHEYGQQQQTGPYHDYNAHQQFVGSPSSVYGEQQYAPSIPPSYRTAAPSIVSPVQQHSVPYTGVGRKPVQGSWRDV